MEFYKSNLISYGKKVKLYFSRILWKFSLYSTTGSIGYHRYNNFLFILLFFLVPCRALYYSLVVSGSVWTIDRPDNFTIHCINRPCETVDRLVCGLSSRDTFSGKTLSNALFFQCCERYKQDSLSWCWNGHKGVRDSKKKTHSSKPREVSVFVFCNLGVLTF